MNGFGLKISTMVDATSFNPKAQTGSELYPIDVDRLRTIFVFSCVRNLEGTTSSGRQEM